MKYRYFFCSVLGLLMMFSGVVNAQNQDEIGLESITASELKDHLYFLASDYLEGRVATTPQYEIAAQYVAAQFAAAGLEPAIKDEDGEMSYFQGVPFAKTVYNEDLAWKVNVDGTESELVHKKDFKILLGSQLNHENLELVWVGFGIEEPDEKWNDFENLDISGKVMVCMGGAPEKKGKPVFPQEIHDKYVGPMGFQNKIGGLFSKGAAGIILIDLDGSTGMSFESIPSQFSNEKYVYKGSKEDGRNRGIPSIYLVKPEFLETIMGDSKNNPLQNPDNILKKYQTMELENTTLSSKVEILTEDFIATNNVVGMVPGTDPDLKNEYIVVCAHLDHVGPQEGEFCNGADDNASGSSGVIEVAEALAMNPCKRTVVFAAFTAEEMGLIGSRYFIGSEAFAK